MTKTFLDYKVFEMPQTRILQDLVKTNRSLYLATFISWLTIILILGFNFWDNYTAETSKAISKAVDVNRMAGTYISGIMRTVDVILHDIAQLAEVELKSSKRSDLKFGDLQNFVATRIKFVPELEVLRIYDFKGDLIASEEPIQKGNVADRDYFKHHLENSDLGLNVSKPILGRTSKKQVIVLSRSLRDEHGVFKGIVAASVSIDYLAGYLSKYEIGKNGSISVFSLDDYTLLTRTPVISSLIGKPVPNSQIFKAVKERGELEGFIRAVSALDGEERVNKFHVNKEYGIIFVASAAVRDFVGSWQQKSLLVALSFLLAIGVFAIGFVRFQKMQELWQRSQFQLVRSEKLASLGEVAAGIAHEINNPLAIISGKVAKLRRMIKENHFDNNIFEQDLEKVEITSRRISRIVKTLGLVSRDTTRDPLQLCLISTIVTDTLELCSERIRTQSISLEVKVEENLSAYARPGEVGQILLNMINNSIDAVSNLPEKWIRIEGKSVGDEVQLSVTDSGKGISEEIVNQLMKPFFTTKAPGKGTGLGLSISLALAKSLNGDLFYQLEKGNTQFVFSLPQASKASLDLTT